MLRQGPIRKFKRPNGVPLSEKTEKHNGYIKDKFFPTARESVPRRLEKLGGPHLTHYPTSDDKQ